MLTAQEIFNQAAEHLLTQGVRSGFFNNENGLNEFRCMYRGPNGTKCAVGIFLDDDLAKECEDVEIEGVVKMFPSLIDEGIKNNLPLVDSLQNCHDNQRVVDWPQALRDIAVSYGLNDDVVTKTEHRVTSATEEKPQ